ncbi:MAG: hypothetical protein OIF57_06645 [Marinobacterium sp.]|nr:hypothetical protein [Marinobacterium sp.]
MINNLVIWQGVDIAGLMSMNKSQALALEKERKRRQKALKPKK